MLRHRISDQFADNYLVIHVGGMPCGLAVLKIREILHLRQLSPLPGVPHFVRGTLSLRGRPVPVLDLRVRLDLPAEFTNHTCIVVAALTLSPDSILELGLIVDAVGDVVSVSGLPLDLGALTGFAIAETCVLGRVTVAGQTITLFDLDRLVDRDLALELAHRPSPVGTALPVS